MEQLNYIKGLILTTIGACGGGIAAALGGWDASLQTLVIFMVIDFLLGLTVAGVFKKSEKSKNGALESNAGWKGLCKKGTMLFFVLIGARLDVTLNTNYMRDAVCIGFIANELISIVENAGLIGIPLPGVITRAIEVLTNKSDSEGGK